MFSSSLFPPGAGDLETEPKSNTIAVQLQPVSIKQRSLTTNFEPFTAFDTSKFLIHYPRGHDGLDRSQDIATAIKRLRILPAAPVA